MRYSSAWKDYELIDLSLIHSFCVNKVDNIGALPPEFYEFYNLGLGDPIAVSSVHGHGTGDLLDEWRR